MDSIQTWINTLNQKDQSSAKRAIQSLNPKERQILSLWLDAKIKNTPLPETTNLDPLKQKIAHLQTKDTLPKKGLFRSIQIAFHTRLDNDLKSKNLIKKVQQAKTTEKPKTKRKKSLSLPPALDFLL